MRPGRSGPSRPPAGLWKEGARTKFSGEGLATLRRTARRLRHPIASEAAMASQATRRRILNDVRRRIEEHGWAVQAVGGCCAVPGCGGGETDGPDFG